MLTGELESSDQLRIYDQYTATLGQKSKEKFATASLKVADLSIGFSKGTRELAGEFEASSSTDIRVEINFVISLDQAFHSEWAYNALEAAVDGVIDFKLEESGDQPRNLIRIRSMRNAGFDGRWHPLSIGENLDVTLEKTA